MQWIVLVIIFLHVKHEQVFINSISTMDLNKIAKPNRWHRTDGWTDWQTPIYSQLYFEGIRCLNSKSALLFYNAYKRYLDLKLALPIDFCYRTFSVWGSDRAYLGSSRTTPTNPFPMPVWRGLLPPWGTLSGATMAVRRGCYRTPHWWNTSPNAQMVSGKVWVPLFLIHFYKYFDYPL